MNLTKQLITFAVAPFKVSDGNRPIDAGSIDSGVRELKQIYLPLSFWNKKLKNNF
jgi:hypothetical protein